MGPNADPDADGLANLAEFERRHRSSKPRPPPPPTSGAPPPPADHCHGATPPTGPTTRRPWQALLARSNFSPTKPSPPAPSSPTTTSPRPSISISSPSTVPVPEAARLHLTGNTLRFSTNGSHHSRLQPQRHRHAGLSDRKSHHPQRQHHRPRQRYSRL